MARIRTRRGCARTLISRGSMSSSRGLTVLLPGILQPLSNAMQPDLDRPLRQVQRPCHLCLRQIVAVAKVYQDSLVRHTCARRPCERDGGRRVALRAGGYFLTNDV